MWIQVRTIDGSQTRTIEDVSRKATIEELRERVWALFDVRPECQRLFYRGKQVRRVALSLGKLREGAAGASRAQARGLGRAFTLLCFGWATPQGAGRACGEGCSRTLPALATGAPSRFRGEGTRCVETCLFPIRWGQRLQSERARALGSSLTALDGTGAPGGWGGH